MAFLTSVYPLAGAVFCAVVSIGQSPTALPVTAWHGTDESRDVPTAEVALQLCLDLSVLVPDVGAQDI